MNPRISVLTTARDGEFTLERCIESVRAQTEPSWEMIIVDDGSQDGTLAIAQRYEALDSRIRVVATCGIGRAQALNMGVSIANGDFIAILDCDDEFHPEKLKIQLAVFDRTENCAVVSCRWIVYVGYEPFEFPPLPEAIPDVKTLTRNRLCYGNVVAHSGALIRRDDLIKVGGYDESRTSQFDYDLWIRFAIAGKGIAIVEQELILLRVHARQKYGSIPRARYLRSSLRLQAGAIKSLGANPLLYLAVGARSVVGMLPRGLRAEIRKAFIR